MNNVRSGHGDAGGEPGITPSYRMRYIVGDRHGPWADIQPENALLIFNRYGPMDEIFVPLETRSWERPGTDAKGLILEIRRVDST